MTGDALNTVDSMRGDSAYSSTGDNCLVIGVFQDVGNNLVRKNEGVIQVHDGTGLVAAENDFFSFFETA
jgi:hypothetical protein